MLMKKLVILMACILLLSMLASCDAEPVETGIETEAPDTLATEETEIPEEPDEFSRFVNVVPTKEEGMYAISFMNGKTVTFDSAAAAKAHKTAQENGFEGDLTRFINLAALDVRNTFYTGNDIGAMAFGKAMAYMMEHYTDYFTMSKAMEGYEVTAVETEGFVNQEGMPNANSATQTYRYTQKIRVAAGQTLELICNGQKVPMRYVTAYKNGAASLEDAMADSSCRTTSYSAACKISLIPFTASLANGFSVAIRTFIPLINEVKYTTFSSFFS